MKTMATTVRPLGQRRVRDPNAGSGILSGRLELVQLELSKRSSEEWDLRKARGSWRFVPTKNFRRDFCVSLHRILVPNGLDEDSAVALDYASALARRFGSEISLLYSFEDSDYARGARVESELRTCFSELLLRHLQARFFLRPGPTGEQVKAVANALGADLIVTSSDYHRRFLSCLTHEETGILKVQGVPCPVVLVNAVCHPRERT